MYDPASTVNVFETVPAKFETTGAGSVLGSIWY